MSLWSSVDQLMTRLCQPSEQAIPDAHSRQIAFNRNKATFPLAVFVGPIYFFLMLFDPTTMTPFHMINCFFLTFNALLWLACCRNYINVFNWYYLIALTAYFPIIVINYSQDLIFFAYVGVMVLPVFFMHLTSSGTISIIAFIGQLVLLNTVYDSQIKSFIANYEAAAREIMIAGNFATIMNIFFTFMSYASLKKAHQEISHTREAKFEQQKSFIFSISHELRNPLNSLLGNISLALFEPSVTEVKRLIGNAHVCGQVLLHLVNNILDSGKVEVSSLEVNPTPTNTKEVIENIWSVCSDLIKKKQLNGILKVSKNMPRSLNIDAYRLMQIMLNLVGNAVKFTEKGSVSIQFQWIDVENTERSAKAKEPLPFDDDGVFEKEEKVALISRMKGETDSFYFLSFSKAMFDEKVNSELESKMQRGAIKISVVDTGCGMSNESMGKLFKMFGQVHEDKSKRKVGTGLGLFITKELCKKMNGEIQVFSKPLKGSAFVVTIPIGPIRTD